VSVSQARDYADTRPDRFWKPVRSEGSLDAAYEVCRRITQHHSRSFYLTSGLLGEDKRRAVRAFYAFCRRSDDLVDVAEVDHGYSLDGWAAVARPLEPPVDDPVLLAWADVRSRYHIPQQYPDELLEGVRMDLTIHRYATFEDLWLYCYRVAATVGLVSMHITGFESDEAIPYAVKAGVALQLTNILRDIGEDAARGRIYLPQEDLRRFDYSEDELLRGVVNDRFKALMEFEMERAERLYEEGLVGIRYLSTDGRFAIASAITVYRAILGCIRANAYDVFTRRAHLGLASKLLILPGVWWRTRG
jgi:15-cis-phytoene synthase